MAQPLNFQPISLQQTLWDQKQLEALCAPRIMPPWEKYHANDNYGFATILKAYSGHPFDKPLPVLLTHGVYFDDQRLYDMERQCGLPGVMSYPDFRTKLWREKTDLRVIPSASPLLYAQRLMDQHFGPPMPEARSGTIYFLPHSTGHIKREIDLDQVITKLKQYCQQQQKAGHNHLLPLSVCIHWQDTQRGKHLPFKRAGLPVISAGHLSDPDFIFRLLHLLRLSNLTLGAFPGGHVFASLVAGVPFIAWEPAKAVAEISTEFKNVLGSQRSPDLSARLNHWESLFQPEQDPAEAPTPYQPITAAQEGFVDMMLGREDLIGPDELFAQLRSFGYPYMSAESRQALDEHFRKRYAENPEVTDCFARLAEGFAQLKNWPAAFDLIAKDRQLERLTPHAELRSAQWLQRMGRESDALDCVRQAYTKDPRLQDGFAMLSQEAIRLRDWRKAQYLLDQDAAAGRLSLNYGLSYAQVLVRNGENERAHHWMARAQAENLCQEKDWVDLWWIKMATRDYEGAIALARRDLEAGRLSLEGQWQLAELYERCGETEQAIALVESVYAENHKAKDWFARLGWEKGAQMADWESAHDWFLRDMNQGRLSVNWKSVFARIKASLDQWDEAFALIATAYAEDPNLTGGYTSLGWWGYRLGRGLPFCREQYQRDQTLKREPPNQDLFDSLMETASGKVLSWESYQKYASHHSHLIAIGYLIFAQGYIELAARLMALKYDQGEMAPVWWPTYALILQSAQQNEQANTVIDAIEAHHSPKDMILIGECVKPKARLTVAELRTWLNTHISESEHP
ncbi:tetratricopeptide repeat protein [Thiorhodovibrio frisius]|uniref:Tetratricopeptide repeat protein n=1 Tax=Thiorhodovibrio frisius TaxID=631362 RepID=H8Z097_9GAMM|nr:hypothetical protein [Thiorhodovibrio frisius]EIC22305.1 hypothetical protein Thi970DRAFT_02558 [Thiorhodovibrio frisius]WPL24602.1 putative PEP-CTERM system TPR-repeat lipoprotein [Thiorhodovibrio frisius]